MTYIRKTKIEVLDQEGFDEHFQNKRPIFKQVFEGVINGDYNNLTQASKKLDVSTTSTLRHSSTLRRKKIIKVTIDNEADTK